MVEVELDPPGGGGSDMLRWLPWIGALLFTISLTYGNTGIWVGGMKTTVELPDELLLLAKRAALERGTTLRMLIENGLARELKDPSEAVYRQLDGVRQLDTSVWEGTSSDDYVTSMRKGWE